MTEAPLEYHHLLADSERATPTESEQQAIEKISLELLHRGVIKSVTPGIIGTLRLLIASKGAPIRLTRSQSAMSFSAMRRVDKLIRNGFLDLATCPDTGKQIISLSSYAQDIIAGVEADV